MYRRIVFMIEQKQKTHEKNMFIVWFPLKFLHFLLFVRKSNNKPYAVKISTTYYGSKDTTLYKLGRTDVQRWLSDRDVQLEPFESRTLKILVGQRNIRSVSCGFVNRHELNL